MSPSLRDVQSSPLGYGIAEGLINNGLPSAYIQDQFRQRDDAVAELNRLSEVEMERRRQLQVEKERKWREWLKYKEKLKENEEKLLAMTSKAMRLI